MKKLLFLIFVPLLLFGQIKYYLPLPILSSNGIPIKRAMVILKQNDVAIDTCVWGTAGLYYYTDTTQTTPGNYDIYQNGVLYSTNVAIGSADNATLRQEWASDIGDSLSWKWKVLGNSDSIGIKKVGVYQHALNDNIIYGQDYGMVGDGVTDNAASFQAAVNSFSYPYYGTILLGDGIFRFSSTVNLKGVGLRLVGNGKSKTVLLFDNSTPDAVFMSMGQTTDYIREASFENMKIINGSDVSTYHKSGKCFDMSTSSGNVRFNKFENLEIYGFKWVVWIEGTLGHDGTVMENCCFKYNTSIWYSDNSQAVNNFLTDCNFEQNDSTLFYIKGGGHFIFRGGSWINKGTTLHLDSDPEGVGIGPGNSTFAFYGVRFEMRENDPTMVDTPKVVYMDKPQHANVSFFSCNNFSSADVAKVYYEISGQTTLEFNNSYMVGDIEATSTASTAAYPDNALIIIKDSKYNGNVIDKDARLYPRIIKNTDFQMDHYVLEAGNNRQYNSESCVSRYIAYQTFTTSPYSFSYIFPVDVAITGVRVLRKYSGCGDITVTLFANSVKTDTIKTMTVPYRTGSDNYYYEPLTSGACVSMADTIYVDITCASGGGNMLKIDVYY